jgi:hypothetical protein
MMGFELVGHFDLDDTLETGTVVVVADGSSGTV